MIRPTTSGGLPGVLGTIIRIGFTGYGAESCAPAKGARAENPAIAIKTIRRFMKSLLRANFHHAA
jgi:hypothetical protein